MRRIIKPFTVELRSGKRKTPTPLVLPSDQPSVDWPEALLAEFRADPEPSRPSGRVLPALDEAPDAMTTRASEAEAAEPDLAASVTEPEPESPVFLEAAMPLEAAGSVEAETPVAATMPLEVDVRGAAHASDSPSIRRARLSREVFARGERWKARLPAAVHRTHRGLRTERGGNA